MAGPKNINLPEKIIIAPTDPIYSAVRRAGGCAGKDKRLGLFRYTEIPGCTEPTAVAGPALGAPAAALLVEHLVPHGVKKIILLSVCGSLTSDLGIGDLFIPIEGLSEEGTSMLYHDGEIPSPDPALIKRFRQQCLETGAPAQEGKIWTTDAPHRETPERIDCFKKQGAIVVDMEYTALATVSRFHGIAFASLMVVSDEVYGKTPKKFVKNKLIHISLQKASKIALLTIDKCH